VNQRRTYGITEKKIKSLNAAFVHQLLDHIKLKADSVTWKIGLIIQNHPFTNPTKA